jgi:hypothetical protein
VLAAEQPILNQLLGPQLQAQKTKDEELTGTLTAVQIGRNGGARTKK